MGGSVKPQTGKAMVRGGGGQENLTGLRFVHQKKCVSPKSKKQLFFYFPSIEFM